MKQKTSTSLRTKQNGFRLHKEIDDTIKELHVNP